MKKLLALLLSVVLCFTLVACGGGKTPTKEELLATAEMVNSADIKKDSNQNIIMAKEKYCNKTLLLSGCVREIKEDHIELSDSYGSNYMVDVYLPLEEMATLKSNQAITVVGSMSDEIIETSENSGGMSFDYNHYQTTYYL